MDIINHVQAFHLVHATKSQYHIDERKISLFNSNKYFVYPHRKVI